MNGRTRDEHERRGHQNRHPEAERRNHVNSSVIRGVGDNVAARPHGDQGSGAEVPKGRLATRSPKRHRRDTPPVAVCRRAACSAGGKRGRRPLGLLKRVDLIG